MQRICWSDWILFCQKKRAKIDFLKTPSSRLSEDGSIGGCESYWRYGWMLWRCDLGVRSLFLTQFLDVRCLLVWQLENSSWDVSCYDCRPTARGNPHHYIYIYISIQCMLWQLACSAALRKEHQRNTRLLREAYLVGTTRRWLKEGFARW